MQQVSQAYRNSMKQLLRNRGYIRVTFGLVNQEAQENATVSAGDFTYYSNQEIFTEDIEKPDYATLEEDFTKVDGSMYFLPKEDEAEYYDTGLVGASLVSSGAYTMTIELNVPALDFRGMTIDFGDIYPVDFDLISSTGDTLEVRDNDQALYSNEVVFEDTTSLTITVYRMVNPDTRLRIKEMTFGYILNFDNDDVLSSTLTSYVSPIGEDVSQYDFSVQITNYDQYFNVDNPESAVNFLETGQQMTVYYGYELDDGTVEWVLGGNFECSSWEADDSSATITCQDVYRNMESEYRKGTYSADGTSFYDLAINVLAEAGIEDYYVDPHLKELYTKNPIPVTTYKEALQMIANATRSILSQTRDGAINIESSFIPDVYVASDDEAPYSYIDNILSSEAKAEYATLATNYTVADGTMFFLPTDSNYLYTGYVSNQLSDENGEFGSNPKIMITQEIAWRYYGVKFEFGHTLPSGMVITTYNDDELVDEVTVSSENISKSTVINYTFLEFDKMIVEFTGTQEPYNRIVLNYFSFGDLTDFTMERVDMLSSPTTYKEELVKEIIVPCYTYQKGTEEQSLISEDVTVTTGDTMTYYFDDACHDYRAELLDESEVEQTVTILDSGSYYVTVEVGATGTFELTVYGYAYVVTQQSVTHTLNSRGSTITWDNPLISDIEMATELAEWLGDYYGVNVEYSYDTRGHPELDANDIIYQENEFYPNMMVRIYQVTLDFNGAFSGSIYARRLELGGDSNVLANTQNRLVRVYKQ